MLFINLLFSKMKGIKKKKLGVIVFILISSPANRFVSPRNWLRTWLKNNNKTYYLSLFKLVDKIILGNENI